MRDGVYGLLRGEVTVEEEDGAKGGDERDKV